MMVSAKDFRIEDETFSNRASVGEAFEISGTLVNLDQNPKQLTPWAVVTNPDRSFLINNIANLFPDSAPTCWQSKSDGNLNWYFYLSSDPSETFTLEPNGVTDYQITLTPKKGGLYHIHSGMLFEDYFRLGPGQTVYVKGSDAVTDGEIFGFYLPFAASIAVIIFGVIIGTVLIRKKINPIKFYKIWKINTKIPILLIVTITISLLIAANYSEENLEEKYQYKFWSGDPEPKDSRLYKGALFSYSHDYGETFSEPIDMSITKLYAHEPKMIVMDTDVILVWRDEIASESGSHVLPGLTFAKSTDFGKNFEKKRIFWGGRPDIKHYDEVLYLTWAGKNFREIWYAYSGDRGETFSEPVLLFEIDWDLYPTEERPMPKIDVNKDSTIISWKMRNFDDKREWIAWEAIDEGKGGTFEISSSILPQ